VDLYSKTALDFRHYEKMNGTYVSVSSNKADTDVKIACYFPFLSSATEIPSVCKQVHFNNNVVFFLFL